MADTVINDTSGSKEKLNISTPLKSLKSSNYSTQSYCLHSEPEWLLNLAEEANGNVAPPVTPSMSVEDTDALHWYRTIET